MSAASLTGGLALTLAVLLGAAVAHKGRVLGRGRASEEPLLRVGERRRRHAGSLLALAAGVETTVLLMLLVRPLVGLVGAAALLAAYLAALRALPRASECRCFGEAFGRETVSEAIRRNAVLAAASVACVAASVLGSEPPAVASPGAAGVALVLLAVLTALALLRRYRIAPGSPTLGSSP